MISIIKNISASVPGIFLSVPFFSTIKLLSESRKLLSDLTAKYGIEHHQKKKKILWFTDTLNDLNGVSFTLKKIASLAYEKELSLNIVSSFEREEMDDKLPPNIMNLPSIYSFNLPGYEKYNLKVPSVLKSMEQIYQYDPDEIIISTPGPLGLLALLASKLLNIKSVGIYHTDFTLQAHKIIKDESIAKILEGYAKSFYSSLDETRVPTKEYIHILENRGFHLLKMKLFRKGIDSQLFSPQTGGKSLIQKKFSIRDGLNLLYVGRVSQDKDLDFLLEVYQRLLQADRRINLLVVGDGPYLKELKLKTKGCRRVVFTGQIEYESLPAVYSGADLFVFPSTTDTFGMVVLEAQSCGLPAIVSDRGGPKEIIQDHRTGFIAEAECLSDWVKKIYFIKDMIERYPIRYSRMKKEARQNVLRNYTWERVLKDLIIDPQNKDSNSNLKQPAAVCAA
jgi:glycosyltransferase involved in cell wall biosynthesis